MITDFLGGFTFIVIVISVIVITTFLALLWAQRREDRIAIKSDVEIYVEELERKNGLNDGGRIKR
jgi:hypothetical protein